MRAYIKDSLVVVNNPFEDRLFIFDRDSRTEFTINEETFNCILDIKKHQYELDELKEVFDEEFIDQLIDLRIIIFEVQKNINNVKKLTKYNNARLFIELTNKCNLKCKHCYGSFDAKNNSVLDFKKLKRVIKEASKNGVYQLDLTGGEPLLYPQLDELLDVAYNEGMLVRIFSNLTLLTNKKLEMLLKHRVKDIVTSIDSSNHLVHEEFRGQIGCFQKTINAIEELKKHNVAISVNTMIGKHNKNNIDELVKFIDGLRVKSVLDVIVPEGRANNLDEDIKISAGIIKKIYDNYYKIIDKNAITINCGIGKRFVYIKSDGNIYICPSLIMDEYKIGDIDNYSTKKTWQYMIETFSYLTCNSKCDDCEKCSGGCRARALQLNGNICSRDDVYCIVNEVGVTND